ncbi:hypothetical protein V7S43_011636 [Phytophthora oleae]|uniref:Ankyrin repeat protein n=1 Tax=Phytophthora oleae TaxID=2107226 RepID=A0ABD3F8Q4_9STRA
MTELPLLIAIALALPSKHQAIDHIPHLINHFLVPPTIDAAVYLDLQLVSKVFGDCRPLTVGAMDGAAALGRLDILDRLDASRSEGCSAAAFNGAAANNHLKVLKWLLRRHSHHCNFTEALASAAGAGHLRVVKVLTKSEYVGYHVLDYDVVMEAVV